MFDVIGVHLNIQMQCKLSVDNKIYFVLWLANFFCAELRTDYETNV